MSCWLCSSAQVGSACWVGNFQGRPFSVCTTSAASAPHNICHRKALEKLSAPVEALNHAQWGLQDWGWAGFGGSILLKLLWALFLPFRSQLTPCLANDHSQSRPRFWGELWGLQGLEPEVSHGGSYHRKVVLVGLKEKIRLLNHVWTFPLVFCTRIFKTAQKCCYFHKILLFQEETLYLCLLTGPPVNVSADLKIKVVFVWKIWTRSLFFVFSVQSSLENSGSTEKLKMCAYMHTHNLKHQTHRHTFGFHPKHFSTRLVRFSENYWHPQASCRARKDELKSQFSAGTVLWSSVPPVPVTGCVWMAQLHPCSANLEIRWVCWWSLISHHTLRTRSRNPGFISLTHSSPCRLHLLLINYYFPSTPYRRLVYLFPEQCFCFASADVLIVPPENIKRLRVSISRPGKFPLKRFWMDHPQGGMWAGVGASEACSFKSRALRGARNTQAQLTHKLADSQVIFLPGSCLARSLHACWEARQVWVCWQTGFSLHL